MSNIRDVAKLSGVSISTVSRYINSSANVNEDTKKKIEHAIKVLSYRPNVLARGVLTKKTRKIGLLIPSVANPFFPELFLSIEEYVQKFGYSLLVYNVKGDREHEEQALIELEENRVEGILVARTENPDLYLKSNIPIVAVENFISVNVPLVISDNIQGGSLAFQHLMELKCKKIIHFSGDSIYEATVFRKNGFIEEARKHNIEVEVKQIKKKYIENAYDDFNGLFEGIEKYDGIFAYNDVLAMKIIQYFSSKNMFYDIGDKVHIIGFDNISSSQLISPMLTTISQNVQQLGIMSAKVLFKLINNESVEKIYKTPVNLIVRESTIKTGDTDG